jgi:hypothetical protein
MEKTTASPDFVQALQYGVAVLNFDTTYTHAKDYSLS